GTPKRYDTSPVASLTMLSASITVTMLRGSPRFFAVALAATASVGETNAPRTKATGHGSPMRPCATTATTVVVASTRPTESNKIGRRLARNSRHEVSHAEE